MQSQLKEKAEVPRRRSTKKQPKAEKEQADVGTFNKTLDCCKLFLSAVMKSGGDIFKLLDPLVGDTQCHMHSILILDILHKCRTSDEFNSYAIENLEEKDQEILAYAVLFSLLKAEHKDKLGFILHEVSIGHFYGSILPSRKRETYCIVTGKKKFNSYSVEFLKSVASEKIRDILNECQASSSIAPLKFLPCFATYHGVLDYIKEKRLPIILTLLTINKQVVDEATNSNYDMISYDVRFYEFHEDEDKFMYKTNLSDFECKIPTLAFNCYSFVTDDTQEFAIDYSVRDLLMLCAASHVQLPGNTKLPDGSGGCEEYVRNLFKRHADISDDYVKYYELGKSRNLIGVQYSTLVRSSVEQGSEDYFFTMERKREDVLFNVDHVQISNYAREYHRVKSLDLTTRFDQSEVCKIDIKKVASEASRSLALFQTV